MDAHKVFPTEGCPTFSLPHNGKLKAGVASSDEQREPFTELENSKDMQLDQLREGFGKGCLLEKADVAVLFENFMKVDSFENKQEAELARKKLPVAPNATDIAMKTGDGKQKLRGDTVVTIDVTTRTVSESAEASLRIAYDESDSSGPLSQLVMKDEHSVITSMHTTEQMRQELIAKNEIALGEYDEVEPYMRSLLEPQELIAKKEIAPDEYDEVEPYMRSLLDEL